MRKISICIPTWKRFNQTVMSFKKVINDDRVQEVIIVDDASMDGSYEALSKYFEHNNKVLVVENETNLDCYRNKMETMSLATSDWDILLDSDNTIDVDYLDAIYAIKDWDEKTIYLPEFASPYFDARQWSGLTITKENVAHYANTNLMTNLNACNFFINRKEYLRVWDGSVNPITSDSIYFSHCWLKGDGKIYITPNLKYEHYISPNNDGHYQRFSHLTRDFHENLMNQIRSMK